MTTSQTTTTKQTNDVAIAKDDRVAVDDVSSVQANAPATILPTKTLTETALEYVKAGLSVMPVSLKKTPALPTWKEYQRRLPEEAELRSWTFAGIAIICGGVSGNLENIDFDEKYNIRPERLFERWKRLVDEQRPGLVDRLGTQQTQSDGVHAFYRCKTIGRSMKLAARETTEDDLRKEPKVCSYTLIETRGEGGYIMCAPSKGYHLTQLDFLHVPEISIEEREILLACARALNEFLPEPEPSIPLKGGKSLPIAQQRPGDQFNREGSVEETLEQAGWAKVGTTGDNDMWRRPGKREGVSATMHREKKLFYVFSSNAQPFEPEKAYTQFTVYCLLEHAGNYSEAARALALKGYGTHVIPQAGANTSIAMVEAFLLAGYDFQINEITQQVEIRKKGTSTFKKMTDTDLNSLFRELQHNRLPVQIDALQRILQSDFSPMIDPFREYFDGLAACDGTTDHIEELASTVTLTRPAERAAFTESLKKWLVAQVACALDEKIANHTALILVGDQNLGKTTWLNRLIPPVLSEYKFVGTIYPDNKDTLVYLAETMLINLDELETLRKAEIGSLKSLMTMTSIKVRRVFERFPRTFVRRASFVGSINNANFLNDPTGSRRFLCFEVKSVDLTKVVDMDAVYGQAYSLYRSGYKYWFSDDEVKTITERNKKYQARSYEHELLNQTCSPGKTDVNDGQWLSATEVAERIHGGKEVFRVDDRSVRALGVALSSEDYTKRRSKGAVKYYVRWTGIAEEEEAA